jgi:hypothetical protein
MISPEAAGGVHTGGRNADIPARRAPQGRYRRTGIRGFS